jgi:hypothetical protein
MEVRLNGMIQNVMLYALANMDCHPYLVKNK